MVHRFSEFDALASELRAGRSPPARLPALPPKMPALLLSQTERQRRVVGLQRWSEHVLSTPSLVAHKALGDFFCLDSGLWHSPAPSPPRVDEALAHAASLLQVAPCAPRRLPCVLSPCPLASLTRVTHTLQASTRTALAVRTRSRLVAATVHVQSAARGRAVRRAYTWHAASRRLRAMCAASPWATGARSAVRCG